MLRFDCITRMVHGLGGSMRRWQTEPVVEVSPAPQWWVSEARPRLDELAAWPPERLPEFVRNCPVTMRLLRQLGRLAWADFPEPRLRHWDTRHPEPRAHFVAAFLVKVVEDKSTMPDLLNYLVEHPALIWLLGFRLRPDPTTPWGFDRQRSLPTHRHFSRVLRELPNQCLQFLLKSSVELLQAALPPDCHFGDEISLDTKHILAWASA
jgi:hypothetical protein